MKNVGILKFALFALVATSQLTVSQVAFSMAENQVANCPVCFEETNQMLHGDHAACPGCLGEQIAHAHANRNGAKNERALNCPRQGCNYQITEADVRRIIPASLAQFQEIQQAQAEKAAPVSAKAQKQDRANSNWQFQNTRPCPQCRTAIEKNGGCKYVRCTRCNTEFCYECLGRFAHLEHPCAPAFDPWAPEKAQLNKKQPTEQEVTGLVIGGVILVAAVWGISELYDYFMIKKAKKPKVGVRKQPVASNAPARQARPARVW